MPWFEAMADVAMAIDGKSAGGLGGGGACCLLCVVCFVLCVLCFVLCVLCFVCCVVFPCVIILLFYFSAKPTCKYRLGQRTNKQTLRNCK